MVGCGSLQMVSEPIPDPNVGVCLALSVWPYNPMGHNEDVMFAWGVFMMSHIGYGRMFVYDVPHRIRENVSDAIYVETSLNQVDTF